MADPEQAYHGDRATNPDSLAIKVARKVTVTVVYEYEGGQKVEQKLRVCESAWNTGASFR
jgi:hypothetical protein